MFDIEVSRQDGVHHSRAALGLPDMPSHGSTLSDALVRIDRAIMRNVAELDSELADILAPAMQDPDLLAGLSLRQSRDCYARHLLHQGVGYSVLALVWMPGQMSPVHCHRTWCVLAVHRGCLTETLFTRGRDGVDVVDARQLSAGGVSHAPSNMVQAHRMANLGASTAISIHIYGAAFDRLAEDVNHIWCD